MKKLLLSLITIAAMSAAIAQNCTADPLYTTQGVYPGSATGLAIATVGVPYAETITTITPVDTCLVILFPPCTLIPIDSVVIDNYSGMPPGFTVVSENETSLPFKFLGGSTSCMVITGTPAPGNEGVYPIVVSGLTWATVFGVATSQPFIVDWYQIEVVTGTVGVNDFGSNDFEVRQNIPNPFSNKSIIEFSLPLNEIVNINIYSVLGEIVKSEEINGQKGMNSYRLNGNDFSNGMYFYSLTYSNQKITKRFIVNK